MFREHYNHPAGGCIRPFLSQLEGEATRKPSARPSAGSSSRSSRKRPRKIGGADFLAQGTLYPDVIESVSFSGGPSVTIKSHHNVGGLPERMNMKLVEPCANCSRTRSARWAASSACPTASSAATRSPARVSPSAARAASPARKLDILRQADAIYLDEIRKAGLYDRSGRPSPCCLPVQTVGVMGDGRTYELSARCAR
jgi:GMP synthase (glutamine-hydrolysing)